MRKIGLLCIACCALLAITGCGGENKSNQPGDSAAIAVGPLPEKGKVISHFKVAKDSNYDYALYLPKNFDAQATWPVILFLDPQGEGDLPLKKYSALADKYGFVLAGSYGSRNSVPIAEAESDYDRIYDDIHRRIQVHPKGMILAGFSGGGRTALHIASSRANVNGVITLSGPNNVTPKIEPENFCLYAVAGYRDFNFEGTKGMQYRRSFYKFENHFRFLDMKHEYLSEAQMEDAFLYMHLKAMAKGAVPRNQALIDSTLKSLEKNYADAKNPIDKKIAIGRIGEFMRGLTDVDKYRAEDSLLAKNPVVTNFETELINTVRMENMTYQNFTEGFKNWTLDEWRGEINRHKSFSNQNNPDGWMHARIIAMMGMNCYKLTKNAVEQSAYEEGDKLVALYEIVEPGNSEHRIMAARLAARRHNLDQVATELEKAIALGFSDSKRLEEEADFAEFRADARYAPLLAKVKNAEGAAVPLR